MERPVLHPAAVRSERSTRVRVLGAGTLLIAAAWAAVGWWSFREIGTLTLEGQINQILAESLRTPSARRSRRSAATRPRPHRRAKPPRKRRAPAANPLSVLTWQPASRPSATAPARARPSMRPNGNRPNSAAGSGAAGGPAGGFHADIAEVTRQVWAALTACLIGAIAVSGLSLVLAGRWSLRIARLVVVTAFLVCAGGLFVSRYAQLRPGQDWIGALISLTQSRHVWQGLGVLGLATMAGAGAFALSPDRRIETWLAVTIAMVFFATLLTLVGLGVLIRYAGFRPLPTWFYAAVAVGQSAWAWILLFIPHRAYAPPGRDSGSNTPG